MVEHCPINFSLSFLLYSRGAFEPKLSPGESFPRPGVFLRVKSAENDKLKCVGQCV